MPAPPPLTEDLALLTDTRLHIPRLDEALAAAALADALLAGRALPADPGAVIRAAARRRRAAREQRTRELLAGLHHASTLPLRPALLAGLAATAGLLAPDDPAWEAAEDVASGVVQLVADPAGCIPDLTAGLRAAIEGSAANP